VQPSQAENGRPRKVPKLRPDGEMAKKKIDGRELVKDVRARMTDLELMQKYKLSPKGLDSVLKKLLEMKAITQAEYDWRPADYDDTAAITQLPKLDD
jgi:hypothetical protein